MSVCEDAPCCGCCGPAVWAAEALAAEEARHDMDLDDDRWFDYDHDVDPDECDHGDRSGRVSLEADAFGYRAELVRWSCDICGTPLDETWQPRPDYRPVWEGPRGLARRLRLAARRA